MNSYTVKLPAFLASALVNGDTSGLTCTCAPRGNATPNPEVGLKDMRTFSDLPIGARFTFASDPRKTVCVKVSASAYSQEGVTQHPSWALGASGFGPMKVKVTRNATKNAHPVS